MSRRSLKVVLVTLGVAALAIAALTPAGRVGAARKEPAPQRNERRIVEPNRHSADAGSVR